MPARTTLRRRAAGLLCVAIPAGLAVQPAAAAVHLDNETLYSNQDPATETRRSEHFRICFGHHNRDTGTPVTEELVQGNLRMFEQLWHHWVDDLGLNDVNESATNPDGNKYRANFNILMTWDDGGGGGAYMSMDANGFAYAMANSGYCRFDPPSGATPHEFGHVWQGRSAGFNGSDSSGAWWECHANWMQLQFLNGYPQAREYLYNGMYYPAHGRDYYDSFMIWEEARENPRYGAAWVNEIWTNATPEQRQGEYILDRMVRLDSSGSPDKAGAMRDLWGNMAKKLVTWDWERQRWLAQVNRADDGSDWAFYQRCRTPLVAVPGAPGWFRPSRGHLPMEYGFNIIPLQAGAGTTASCDFQPQCDPVRGSDWRACLVAVNSAGEASYSTLWNKGTNSLALSADHARLYLVVIATPRPMKIPDPAWRAYLTDAGLQFPYAVAFGNAAPRNVIYPPQGRSGMTQHPNGGGWKANTATVDATAWVGPDAQVLNSAQVRGNARIEDYAVVRNSAKVRDNAVVSGHAEVKDNAQVYGNAKVRDWARVFGHAEVCEDARVIEHANCGDGNATTHTKVYGNAVIKGTTYVYDTSTFNGCLIMDGDSANGNGTTPSGKGVHFGWGWGQDTARFAALPDNGYLYARHSFEKDNPVFALDEFGINHGILVNGCRSEVDTAAPARGGRVLPLDGASHYVELHNSVNDFRETTISVWLKWAGGAAGQRAWSMGDGAGRVMDLTPADPGTGALRFRITDGTTTEALDGPALAANAWRHVAVVFAGTTSTLYVDGVAVAGNPAATLFPDQLNAPLMENANFLGRGNSGDYFHGRLDDFRLYMKGLSAAEVAAIHAEAAPAPVTVGADTTAPTPDAATWLVEPVAVSDTTVTMSATPGSDASGWVEYYFTCTAGGGHDSGWVSFHNYTDVGLPPGAAPSYTVRMRDRTGNVTSTSAVATVTPLASAAGTAAFASGPVGIASGQVRMSAAEVSHASNTTEYKFDCVTTGATSGWRSSPTWTHTGLTTGNTYAYTVTVRDGRGNTSAPSAQATAVARDDAPPALATPAAAQWEMRPYATIDNRISMTATAPQEGGGVEYQFECVSGGGPNSSWQSSRTFKTAALPDGSYVYRYKLRDTTRQNESGFSDPYTATITRTTGYHSHTLEQVLVGLDDDLVSFPATVIRVNADHYEVKDLATGAAIKVRPDTIGLATNPALALRNVAVKGHLYTLAGERVVTYAALAVTGDPMLSTVSGRVTATGGVPIAGATVYFSDTPGAVAGAVVTATTDSNGYYSRGLTDGTWHVAAGAATHNPSADQQVVVAGSSVSGVDFTLAANTSVSGTVTRLADGAPVAGAAVHFSRSPEPSAQPVFTATTDAGGHYAQAVQDGAWFVDAAAAGLRTSAAKAVAVGGVPLGGIDFALAGNARSIPRTADLLFAALTEALPAAGPAGAWPLYQPAGASLAGIGSPTVALSGGDQWVDNVYLEGDGFLQGTYSSAVPVNGATIVVAARPLRNTTGTSWTSIVDLFYNRLVLGIRNSTGRIDVCRNGSWNSSTAAIPSGQATVLSLVVQPTGQYKVFANGSQVMNVTSTSDMTALVPNVAGPYANAFNVGRNNPDGWTTFNGQIGDVFVYGVALAEAERQQLEADLAAKFLGTDHTISATAGSGGTINPFGAVPVPPGASQTFTITPLAGYQIASVLVDGAAQGPLASYTFTNVTSDHTISATFSSTTNTPPTISTIADQSVVSGTATAAIPFTVGDAETAAGALAVSGASSDTALVPVSNIVFGGADATRTVTVTPAAGLAGSATITVTVRDGAASAAAQFVLTVTEPPTGEPVTVTFQAGDGKLGAAGYADATLYQNSPGTNFGSATTLNLKDDPSGTDDRIALVGFFGIFGDGPDRIPPGATIESATLRLVNADDRGKQNDIHVVERAWSEAAVTWDSFFAGGGFGSYLTTIGTSSGIAGGSTHTIDIRSVVQGWANDPATNCGLLLRSNGVGSYSDPQQWVSGEHSTTASRPLLTVTFLVPQPPFEQWQEQHFDAAQIAAGLADQLADPDRDGRNNFWEFAFHGDPLSGADGGAVTGALRDGADADNEPEMTITFAVRRGAVFTAGPGHAMVSAAVDGVVYQVEASATLGDPWDGEVSDQGASDAPPPGTALPDLTGTDWEYHTFSAFNGAGGRGFLRVKAAAP